VVFAERDCNLFSQATVVPIAGQTKPRRLPGPGAVAHLILLDAGLRAMVSRTIRGRTPTIRLNTVRSHGEAIFSAGSAATGEYTIGNISDGREKTERYRRCHDLRLLQGVLLQAGGHVDERRRCAPPFDRRGPVGRTGHGATRGRLVRGTGQGHLALQDLRAQAGDLPRLSSWRKRLHRGTIAFTCDTGGQFRLRSTLPFGKDLAVRNQASYGSLSRGRSISQERQDQER
jgi:hypothetical protein